MFVYIYILNYSTLCVCVCASHEVFVMMSSWSYKTSRTCLPTPTPQNCLLDKDKVATEYMPVEMVWPLMFQSRFRNASLSSTGWVLSSPAKTLVMSPTAWRLSLEVPVLCAWICSMQRSTTPKAAWAGTWQDINLRRISPRLTPCACLWQLESCWSGRNPMLSVCFQICYSICSSVQYSVCSLVCYSICYSVCFPICSAICHSVCYSVCYLIFYSVCYPCSYSVCYQVCYSVCCSVCYPVCSWVCLPICSSIGHSVCRPLPQSATPVCSSVCYLVCYSVLPSLLLSLLLRNDRE